VKKNGRLGEDLSLNLRKTVNERATLYPAKMKNFMLLTDDRKNGGSRGEGSNVVGTESFERASLYLATYCSLPSFQGPRILNLLKVEK
jgi:hypothetical protein